MSGSKRKGDLGKSRAALTDNSPKQRVLAAGEWYIGGDSAWHPDLLQVGDIIVELNGMPTKEMELEEFIEYGTGPEGTTVSFRLLGDSEQNAPRSIVRQALSD